MHKLKRIPLQFFGEVEGEGPQPDALKELVDAYEAKLAEVTKERDLAQAQNVEYKRAINTILNGRTVPNPEAPDAATFAKSCKF